MARGFRSKIVWESMLRSLGLLSWGIVGLEIGIPRFNSYIGCDDDDDDDDDAVNDDGDGVNYTGHVTNRQPLQTSLMVP